MLRPIALVPEKPGASGFRLLPVMFVFLLIKHLHDLRENILAEIQCHVSEVLGSGLFFFRKDEGRSAAVEQVQMGRQSQLSVDDQSERVLSVPFAYRERRIVEQGRASSYEDGFLFGPHLVNRQGGERSGKAYRVSVFTSDVQKTVGRLCPFQGDVRALFQVECHESTNQFPAFFSSTPTVTSMPASRNFWIPLPATKENGSTQPTTTLGIPFRMIKSAQGGVFP